MKAMNNDSFGIYEVNHFDFYPFNGKHHKNDLILVK